MSLMNLGAALGAGDDAISVPLQVMIGILAVAGFAAAVGLALRTPWGRAAVLGTGASPARSVTGSAPSLS